MHSYSLVESAEIRAKIRGYALRVARSVEFCAEGADDLEQELMVHLLSRIGLFDANKSPMAPFVHRLMTQAVSNLVRARRARKRVGSQAKGIDPGTLAGDRRRDESDAQRVSDLELDVANVLATLSPLDRRLAEQLMYDRPPEIEHLKGLMQMNDDLHPGPKLSNRLHSTTTLAAAARALGIPRRTARDRLGRIRKRFEDAGLKIYC